MDSSRWPSLSSGQSDRKINNREQQTRPSSNPFLPQRRPSDIFSNNIGISPLSTSYPFNLNNINSHSSSIRIMSQRVRQRNGGRNTPYPPPRLQHRTSQTVIDLTGESDESSPPRAARLTVPRPSNQRPPRLGRNDILDDGELIDLTEDGGNQSEAELDILEVLQRQPNVPRPDQHRNRARHQHHSGFDYRRPANLANPPRRNPEPPAADLFLPLGPNDPHRLPQPHPLSRISHHIHNHLHRAMANHGPGFMGLIGRDLDLSGMNGMNYDAIAFAAGAAAEPEASRKTPHVPPKPARSGFTRSPAALKEDQILICPACEEELVIYQNEKPAPTTNAKGKALTDKERAEHPFWVVKKCGHVFCNKCYQDRKNKNGDCKFYLPNQNKTEKTLICPIDECNSAVAKPGEWVGIYL